MTPLLTRAMCHLLLLSVRQQLFQPHQILLRHHARRAQLTLTLARLLGEDVTTMGLGSFEPFGSLAKTLRRCPVGLQLGHNNSELVGALSLRLARGAPQYLGAGQRPKPLLTFCVGPSPTNNYSSLFLLRPEHHHHLPPFHQRVLLDLRIRRQICRYPLQELAADFLMCHFTAAEPHGYLGLVAFLQEADQV